MVTAMITWLLIAPALAGYGVPVDGRPSIEERRVHQWTNAVRMDPKAFQDDYGCWQQFADGEKESKPPLASDDGLNEVARHHTIDMMDNDELSHQSSDGTAMAQRVAQFYDYPYTGENVAWGYADAYEVVVEGWMCSAGHRENIMWDDWTDMGTGAVDVWWTQNFGGQPQQLPGIVMGTHEFDGTSITLKADVSLENVQSVEVEIDGQLQDMELWVGTDTQGVYTASSVHDGECHTYRFQAVGPTGVHSFPEEGVFAWGDCLYDDEEAGYLVPESEEITEDGCGCTTGHRSGWAGIALGLTLLVSRRRAGRSLSPTR
jgi:hypothetical protein